MQKVIFCFAQSKKKQYFWYISWSLFLWTWISLHKSEMRLCSQCRVSKRLIKFQIFKQNSAYRMDIMDSIFHHTEKDFSGGKLDWPIFSPK